jgi:hypothetical protein
MNEDLWFQQFNWHLRRRALITVEDAGVDKNFTKRYFEQGVDPKDAVIDFIEDGGLDDVVENPWVGPSKEYWRKWERENPFPNNDTARHGRAVSGKTVS